MIRWEEKLELDLEKRVTGKSQTATKSYSANVDGKPLGVLCTITLLPDGKSMSMVEVNYGFVVHQYTNGKKAQGVPIKDETLLDALEKILPKEVKNQIAELNGNMPNGWKTVASIKKNGESKSLFERMIGSTKFTVEYALKMEGGNPAVWVAVTNGKLAKVYRDGEMISKGIAPIQNEVVKSALRELPNGIGKYIPEIW